MRLSRPGADVYVPDDEEPATALGRVTHLGIAAHADDLEILAWHGIRAGLAAAEPRFGGVVCTDGAGAPAADPAASPDAAALRETRRAEQRAAARRGRYAVVVQLDHPSAAVKRGVDEAVVDDLVAVLAAAHPRVVYTHNPADAHETHVGVCVAALDAIRRLPDAQRPERVWGCEVWRSLDWAPGAETLALGDADEATWQALLHEFASQNASRPYGIGAPARARANAVFRESHEAGGREPAWLALDLTPLVRADGPDLEAFVRERLDRFSRDVLEALVRTLGDGAGRRR